MIGHNNGPPIGDVTDVGGRARLYAWRKAHKAAWRTPPIEIVRLRARAAEQLGLSYKDYTSILLDRGRRPSAIFFHLGGTLLRMRNNAIQTDGQGAAFLMPGVERKLQRLKDCSIFVLVDQARMPKRTLSRETVETYVRQLGTTCASITDHAVHGGTWDATRSPTLDMVNALLAKHKLPPSQAVLVGDTAEDEKAAENAGLARFLWSWAYFGDSLGSA